MFEEPPSYWEFFKRRAAAKRLEEHWLIQSAAWTVWGSLVATGAVCLAGICAIALVM